MASWFRALGIVIVSVAAACSSSNGSSGGVGSTGDAGASSTPSSPTEICSMYVSCMSFADPAGLGVVLAAYGPTGTCWTSGETTSLCEQACIAGIAQERETHSFDDACPMCATDGDCALAGTMDLSGGTGESSPLPGDSKSGYTGPTNTPVCSAGTCVCAPTAHACSGDGDCCSGDCEAGICTCAEGTAVCGGGVCQDVTSDNDNGGACGHTCPDDAQCTNGVCDCVGFGAGNLACGDECVDVTSDPNNCGACGVTCSGNTSVCESGVCSCGGEQKLCNGTCADVTTDPNNCGACGAACPVGTICLWDGTCGLNVANPATTLTCDAVCGGVSASCTVATGVFAACDGTVSAPTCGETVAEIVQADLGTCFPPTVTSLDCVCGAAKVP